jgi:hypothetical protein
MGPPPSASVVVSAAERYLPEACRALGRAFPGARVEAVAPEVAWVEESGLTVARVAAACRVDRESPGIPFARHLAAVDVVVPLAGPERVADEVAAAVAAAGELLGPPGSEVALQVWTSGQVPVRAPDPRPEPLWG